MTRHLFKLAILLALFLLPSRAGAAIGEGPKFTNSIAAEQKKNTEFYRAEQSFQEKLKVGRERYEQKQVARGKVAAAMASELQARQQIIILHPVAAPDTRMNEPISPTRPWLTVGVLMAVFVGLGCTRIRFNPAGRAPLQRPKPTAAEILADRRKRYKVTALQPVTIWATVEVPPADRPLLGKPAQRLKSEPAWIHLQAGEIRDKLAVVVGIHPNCAPRERRIPLDGYDEDIIPLGTWTDKELPMKFYEFLKLELSA